MNVDKMRHQLARTGPYAERSPLAEMIAAIDRGVMPSEVDVDRMLRRSLFDRRDAEALTR